MKTLSRSIRKKESFEEDFELNIASIIDCFTVLITYLLFSASFISLGVFDVQADTAGDAAAADKLPKVSIQVGLRENKNLQIKVTGVEVRTIPLQAKDGTWNLGAMTEQLQELKQKFPEVETGILAADNSVEYKEIIKVLEATRKTLPHMALGELED